MEGKKQTEEEKPKPDMSAAAKKAWETRRKKYGDSGLSKKTEEAEKGGKVASKETGDKAEKNDAKAEQLKNVIKSQSETPSD